MRGGVGACLDMSLCNFAKRRYLARHKLDNLLLVSLKLHARSLKSDDRCPTGALASSMYTRDHTVDLQSLISFFFCPSHVTDVPVRLTPVPHTEDGWSTVL